MKPYLHAVDLVISDTGIAFDTAPVAALLDSHKAADERNALIDLVELNRYAQSSLQAIGFDGINKLRTWIDALPAGSSLRTELTNLDVLTASAVAGSSRNDIFIGSAASNSFNGGAGDDLIDGGAGNDSLGGGDGNDTYLFGKGDGQDTIGEDYSRAAGKLNILQFKAGVAASEVLVSRSGSSLVLKIAGTTDKITADYFFSDDDPANASNPIQLVRFADGSSWGIDTIKSMALAGNDLSQTLTGYITDDILDGGAGNDYLSGRAGNDTYLFGKGDGQDTLGEDYSRAAGKLNILQFKAGVAASEVLVSRSGSSLVLKIAGTTDKITADYFFYDDDPANVNNPVQQVRFADGSSWDLKAIKSLVTGNHMPVLATAIADQAVVRGQQFNFALPQLTFTDPDVTNVLTYSAKLADGQALSSWLSFDAVTRTFTGSSASAAVGLNSIRVTATDDFGVSANDVFDLTVQAGLNHPQVVNNADGDQRRTALAASSTVTDSGGTMDHVDLFAGITRDQLQFPRNGDQLELNVAGQMDKLIVNGWYGLTSSTGPIEEFRLGNGDKVLASEVEGLVSAMAQFNASSSGSTDQLMRALPAWRYEEVVGVLGRCTGSRDDR